MPKNWQRRSSVTIARAAGERTGHRLPQIAASRPYLELIEYHLSEVSANEPILTEIRRDSEVTRCLAIFAVEKLCRFEHEERQ